MPRKTSKSWGQSGNWDILVDPSLGNGCLIQAEFQDGSLVRIGFDRNTDQGYVTAFNDNWGDIQAGTEYPITYDIDNQTYEGTATGIILNGVPGADVYFEDYDFVIDIALKHTMTLSHDGAEVMSIDLTGTHAALEGALECQDENG